MNPENQNRDIVNDLFPLHSSIVKFLYCAGAVILLLTTLVIWTANMTVGELMGIVPTHKLIHRPKLYTLSKSMDPYELTFRSRYVDGKRLPPDHLSAEWQIKLPRAFIATIHGNSEAVETTDSEEATHSTNIGAIVLPDGTIVPNSLVIDRSAAGDFFGISIRNSPVHVDFFKRNLCIIRDDFNDLQRDVSGSRAGRSIPLCKNGETRCHFETNYQGWEISVLVDRKSEWFQNPTRACEFAKDFVKRYTVKIDALHGK